MRPSDADDNSFITASRLISVIEEFRKHDPELQAQLAAADARVPEIFEGIQANHCRRPTCRNFGVDPVNGPRRRGGSKRAADPNYTLADVKVEESLKVPGLRCKVCGDNPPLKSNRGIHEEYKRAGAHFRVWLAAKASPPCPTAACPNHGRGVAEHPDLYWRFGTTTHGSIRWRCNACNQLRLGTFSAMHQGATYKDHRVGDGRAM